MNTRLEYKRGYESGISGDYVWCCPYRSESRHAAWKDGYIAGLQARCLGLTFGRVKSGYRAEFKRSWLPPELQEYSDRAVRVPLITSPAIYFLMKAGRVLYVGQSQNVLSRVSDHCVRQTWDEIVFIPVELADLNSEERRFIALLRPPLNKTCGLYSDESPYRKRKRAPRSCPNP